MKRALKWLLPALVAVEVALVWFDLLDFGDAIVIVAGIEVLLVLTGIGELALVMRRYRRCRASGIDAWTALEDSLSLVIPHLAAKLAISEPRMFVSLARWTLRRVPRDENDFGYHQKSTMGMLVVMVLLVSPVELLVLELLLPWTWLRLLLLFLGVYVVFWFLGFYASLVTLPHRLEEDGLRLRYGLFAEAFVRYDGIESVERKKRKAPKTGDGLQAAPEEEAVYFAVGGRINVTLRLKTPLSVRGFFGETIPVRTIHAHADEPERLIGQLKEHLGQAPFAVAP